MSGAALAESPGAGAAGECIRPAQVRPRLPRLADSRVDLTGSRPCGPAHLCTLLSARLTLGTSSAGSGSLATSPGSVPANEYEGVVAVLDRAEPTPSPQFGAPTPICEVPGFLVAAHSARGSRRSVNRFCRSACPDSSRIGTCGQAKLGQDCLNPGVILGLPGLRTGGWMP